MVMVGQHKRISEPFSWGRRERLIVTAVLTVLIAAVVVAAVAIPGAKKPKGPCVTATFASTTGSATIRQCGNEARTLCRKLAAPGGTVTAIDRQLLVSCREERLAPAA